MVRISHRLITGFEAGKNAVMDIAVYAFLLGTLYVLYEILNVVRVGLDAGLEALDTVDVATENGVQLVGRIFYEVLSIGVSVIIDFSTDSPMISFIIILSLIAIIAGAFIITEGALVFLTAFITMSFFTFSPTINWNAFTAVYNASGYPLGPNPYYLLPPAIITLYAYQVAYYKTDPDSSLNTIVNGFAVTVGYCAYVALALIIFIGVPKLLVSVMPGWDWFIQFNQPIYYVVGVVLVAYPVSFAFLGGILAVTLPGKIPELTVRDDGTAVLFQLVGGILSDGEPE